MHRQCNKLLVNRRSARLARAPARIGHRMMEERVHLCLLQDSSHQMRSVRCYCRPDHAHSSSLGGGHLVARYLCTCQSSYPPVHTSWSSSRMSTYPTMTSRNVLSMLWTRTSLLLSITLLSNPLTALCAFRSGIAYVQYEGSDSRTSGLSAAIMAASSRISFKVGRTG